MAVPLPDPDLARRVGVLDQDNPGDSFDDLGRAAKETLLNVRPAAWFDGKRVLDFGCGSGKLLRHLDEETQRVEIHGCDIHEPSIRWVRENLNPAFQVFVCEETPPLERPADHFDLAWAGSVFTHLADYWAEWLLEIHRVLRPGGWFVSTFLGKGMSEPIAHEPWDPDRIGMNVLKRWQHWDAGGPSVQHSEWWLREHWGRLFDIETVQDQQTGHGVITVRKRRESISREDLVRLGDDPREQAALAHAVEQLQQEAAVLAESRDAYQADRAVVLAGLEDCRGERDRLAASLADAERMLAAVQGSRSWKATAPLRSFAARRR